MCRISAYCRWWNQPPANFIWMFSEFWTISLSTPFFILWNIVTLANVTTPATCSPTALPSCPPPVKLTSQYCHDCGAASVLMLSADLRFVAVAAIARITLKAKDCKKKPGRYTMRTWVCEKAQWFHAVLYGMQLQPPHLRRRAACGSAHVYMHAQPKGRCFFSACWTLAHFWPGFLDLQFSAIFDQGFSKFCCLKIWSLNWNTFCCESLFALRLIKRHQGCYYLAGILICSNYDITISSCSSD